MALICETQAKATQFNFIQERAKKEINSDMRKEGFVSLRAHSVRRPGTRFSFSRQMCLFSHNVTPAFTRNELFLSRVKLCHLTAVHNSTKTIQFLLLFVTFFVSYLYQYSGRLNL